MKTTTKPAADRTLLLRFIDQGYGQKAWHGTTLKGSVRGVTAAQAQWRPARGRRNIAEIIVHCAYWKYAVRRRISGGKRGSFPLNGSNWFALPAKLTPAQWREYTTLLEREHRALRDAVADAPWTRLAEGPGGGGRNVADHVFGIAFHDVYHAGQVQTLKALYKSRTK